MSRDYELVIVVDSGGRQYIGKLVERNKESIILEDHLKYVEREFPVQGGAAQIQLQFSPPSHLFSIIKIELKWISVEGPDDEKIYDAYEKFWDRIRAARSGITLASSMPQFGPVPTDKVKVM